MSTNILQVEQDMVVSLSYVLKIKNKASKQDAEKLTTAKIIQGRKQLVPGLEQALYGMRIGDEKDITVEPANAYGEVKPTEIQTLPRNSVPSFANATPGQRLRLLHKKSGEVRRATVVDVQTDSIVLNFNHPLAGKTLSYHIHIDDIREATPKELQDGQVINS